MDHWFAADDLSRGIHGETACLTFRDRYKPCQCTGFLAAIGVFDKSAVQVCNFLVNLLAPGESIRYCYTDGSKELATAC